MTGPLNTAADYKLPQSYVEQVRWARALNTIKTYAWYNGVPLCKTWVYDGLVKEEPCGADEIQQHNSSPVTCFPSSPCWNCVEVELQRRRRLREDRP